MKPVPREFLLNRKRCCGCGCTNCPYFPKHQIGNTTVLERTDMKNKKGKEIDVSHSLENVDLDNAIEDLIELRDKLKSEGYSNITIDHEFEYFTFGNLACKVTVVANK